MFYFVRHGSTDYSEINTKIYQGFGVNLLPMSDSGIAQIKQTAKDPRLSGADLILSSPYTRAVQTAAILSKATGADIVVETGLHEWIANKNYVFEPDEVAEARYGEFLQSGGVYPSGQDFLWESTEIIQKRVCGVLEKYKHLDKVIVTCHSMMMEAVTGCSTPKNGEIVEFDL